VNTPERFAVPDAIEPVTGWRAWALARTPDGRPELRPIIYAGERWPAGAVARAECPPHAASGETKTSVSKMVVRKGLVDQTPGTPDQRQRLLRIHED
jgi:hypothetical protein